MDRTTNGTIGITTGFRILEMDSVQRNSTDRIIPGILTGYDIYFHLDARNIT